jgi:uncharacterized membrane protein
MNSLLSKIESGKFPDILMICIICLSTLFLFFTGWSRHYGFLTSINDLGHYDQAIWGILHKGFFLNTILFNTPFNKLGFHFDPVLYLFSPFYLIRPSVNWLIFGQAFSLSVSAWPIYRLAGHYTQTKSAGILWSLAYLINPFLLNAGTWDFHPVTLAVPFVALAALAIEKKRFYTLLLACFFIMSCMEHFGLMVAGFGLLWGIRNRDWPKGLLLVGLGSAHFYLVFHYVMPAFSPTGGHVMMAGNQGQLSRYAWLGTSVSDILQTLLHHPLKVLKISLFDMGGLAYLLLLVLPFIGMPVLGFVFLIPAVGDLAANLLSANPMPRGFWAYHSATIMPLFCAAAIRGGRTFLQWKRSFFPRQLAGFILLTSMVFGYILTTLPLPFTFNFWAPRQILPWPDPNLEEVARILGPDASLSVQANIGPHFSRREEIYTFPSKVGEAEILVLRLESPTNWLMPQNVGVPGALASHLQLEPNEYLARVRQLLQDDRYGIVFWQDPWLVLKIGQEDRCPKEPVEEKIDTLRKIWN